MEIAITALTIIVSLQIIFNVILAISNDNLKSKIDKQQEQMSKEFEYINERLNRHLELFECMTQVSQDIATKVISIEKRVDELESLLDFYAQMIERNRISIADIEYQLKNSDFNGD